MKILIRNVDNVVIYAQAALALSAAGLVGDGWIDPSFTPENSRLEEVDEIPPNWAGGVWSFQSGAWSIANQARHEQVIKAASPVPESVSALQGLLALHTAGISEAYEAWAKDPARSFVERAFIDKAMTWHRNDATLTTAAGDLNLSSDNIDDLFKLAATL